MNGDTVIQQSQTIYDPGSRPVASLSFQRESTSLLPEGTLDGTNSYRNASVTWYDIGDRVTHSATFGSDDGPTYYVLDATGGLIDADLNGVPDVAEAPPLQPSTSDDYIVSKTEYDSAGRAYRTIDNLGRITQTEFDLLNRTVAVIQNYVDGIVTETETDTDVTVEYDYDAAGRMTILRARNPKGTGNGVEDQETRYLFESDINGSWQTAAVYPDSSDVLSQDQDTLVWTITTDNGDHTSTTYDRLGRTIDTTDQRGVVHEFEFDDQGRLKADKVSDLGSSGSVNDSVLRIERSYDDMSRVATVTSYDDDYDANPGNIVNQVAYEYNGYGLASVVRQGHDGAVDANTPKVTYNYDDGVIGGQAKYVRLASVEYPGGREVFYVYPTTGVGAVLSRVEAIADDPDVLGGGLPTVTLAEYSYLGTSTIVEVRHPDVNGGLTLNYNASGNYEGWDRFGRVVNQQWTDAAGTTTLDHYSYTYDRNSNRTSRSNELNTALSESYGYDGLDRLVNADRAGSDFQDWGLDALGNWNDFTDQDATETRTHNAANELTDIDTSGVIDPAYDAAGNMMSGPRPDDPTQRQHYIWDAWNRLVEVLDDDSGNPGTTIADFEYDGRNYRIQKTAGGVLQAFFHNEGHQVLEVRKDGDPDPSEQYVWDLRYIDAPVVRFHDANTDGTLDDTLYYANDANMNVTALIDVLTGNVVERYHYDPYGEAHVYDHNWISLPVSARENAYIYSGRYFDADIGLFYSRARYYDPWFGRFVGRDPLGYADSTNLYAYVQSRPITFVDPSGRNTTQANYATLANQLGDISMSTRMVEDLKDLKNDSDWYNSGVQKGEGSFDPFWDDFYFHPSVYQSGGRSFGRSSLKTNLTPLQLGVVMNEVWHAWWDKVLCKTSNCTWLKNLFNDLAQNHWKHNESSRMGEEAASSTVDAIVKHYGATTRTPHITHLGHAQNPGHKWLKSRNAATRAAANKVMSVQYFETVLYALQWGCGAPNSVKNAPNNLANSLRHVQTEVRLNLVQTINSMKGYQIHNWRQRRW